MDDQCDFQILAEELKEKLSNSFEKFVNDAVVSVTVKLGKRKVTEAQKKKLTEIISTSASLVLKDIHSEPDPSDLYIQKLLDTNLTIHRGTIRSGQVLDHEGNLLHLGDINPGGSITVTGDLYVMGALRGLAHAGSNGNEQAVIVASHMQPTQLRIAGVISRPPDEWVKTEAYMEFAYLEDGQMKIDKVSNLHKRK
jgi:septum site-determining protein MinC